MELINNFIRLILKLFRAPRRFFAEDFHSLSFSYALCLGLIAHWLGVAGEQIMSQVSGFAGLSLTSLLDEGNSIDSLGRHAWYQNASHLLKAWMANVSTVILDPFYTLLSTAFSSIFIFVGARLFISPNARTGYGVVRYQTLYKLMIVALVPSLFLVLPGFGSLIALVWGLVLLILGIQEVFGASTGVAIVVALFPKLLLIACAAAVLLLVLVGMFALI